MRQAARWRRLHARLHRKFENPRSCFFNNWSVVTDYGCSVSPAALQDPTAIIRAGGYSSVHSTPRSRASHHGRHEWFADFRLTVLKSEIGFLEYRLEVIRSWPDSDRKRAALQRVLVWLDASRRLERSVQSGKRRSRSDRHRRLPRTIDAERTIAYAKADWSHG